MTDSPLRGVHVLIPRAPGRGDALAARIEAAGGRAVVAPLISRADAEEPDREALRAAADAARTGGYGWVAVTSVNAVTALVEADASAAGPRAHSSVDSSTAISGLVRWPVRWAVVGPATGRALRALGIEPALVAAENSAVGMLAEWPQRRAGEHGDALTGALSSNRVLLPLGDLAEPTLERGLPERGFTPVRVTAYRTVSHPAPPDVVADWAAGRFHLVVLTSGSVAREVARQLGVRSDVLAVAIGEPTRRAAEGTGQHVAAVATGATDDALFSAIIDAAALLPATPPEEP